MHPNQIQWTNLFWMVDQKAQVIWLFRLSLEQRQECSLVLKLKSFRTWVASVTQRAVSVYLCICSSFSWIMCLLWLHIAYLNKISGQVDDNVSAWCSKLWIISVALQLISFICCRHVGSGFQCFPLLASGGDNEQKHRSPLCVQLNHITEDDVLLSVERIFR